MRALIRCAALLYPRRWRERYGVEFDVLLDDAGADTSTALNVFSGAISMQIRSWNVGKILATAGVVGALVALGIALEVRKVYVSTSVVKVSASSPEQMRDSVNRMANNIISRPSLTQTINRLGLYPRERAKMPIEDVIERMQKNIAIRPIASTSSVIPTAFAVQFNYSDPSLAQEVTQDLTAKFINLNAQQRSGSGSMVLEVLDPASLPDHASSPNTAVIGSVGLVGGLVLGGIFALIVRLTRRKAA
jgi:uncharacterized protein involved in exopolysaccharide biosynthesis